MPATSWEAALASYTFDNITCAPRIDQMVGQVNPGESLYSVRNIPYSSSSVLDLGGLGVRRYGPIEVKVDPDDAADFEALLQESAELVVNGTTYARATLVELSNKQVTARNDWVFYTAQWVVG
jgi:hypothetical protein